MVAIASRCLPCKVRKVKCDQAWPQCGQCQRGKRECPGPPERLKFVSEQTYPPARKSIRENKKSGRDILIVKSPRSSYDSFRNEVWDVNDTLAFDELVETEASVEVDNPYLFDHLPMTPANCVATRLVHMETATWTPFHLGNFVKFIPAMLESSSALTATAACCVDACARNERHSFKTEVLDPVLYGKALKSIHNALDSPTERTSVTTFLAVALMQRMETTFASRTIASIPCWSIHAGGVSELLRYRGVFDPNEDIIFETVCENIGPIVSHSVFQEAHCFLESVEWQSIFQRRESPALAHRLLCVVLSQLSFLPRLIKCLRLLKRGEGTFTETMELAFSMKGTIDTVGTILDEKVIPLLEVFPPCHLLPGAPVFEVFNIQDQEVARVICWHACLTIMLNNIVSTLLGDNLDTQTKADMDDRNLLVSSRLWMLSDQARRSGLMRFYFYSGALATTYESAGSDETRQWIIDLLSDVHGSGRVDSPWTHEAVQRACDTLAGR